MMRYRFNRYLVFILVVTSSIEVIDCNNDGRLFFQTFPFESLTVLPFFHGFCTLQNIARVITDNELSNLIQIIATRRNMNAFDFVNKLQIDVRRLNGLSQTLKVTPRDVPDYVIKPTQNKQPSASKSRKVQPPSGRNPRPPPDAIIYIVRENFKDQIIPPISFSVPPSMSAMDALHLVSRHFAAGSSPTFPVQVKMSDNRRCHVVDRIGNYSQNGGFYWQLVIIDKDDHILTRGPCIPGPEEVLVLPGTRIYLVHTSVE